MHTKSMYVRVTQLRACVIVVAVVTVDVCVDANFDRNCDRLRFYCRTFKVIDYAQDTLAAIRTTIKKQIGIVYELFNLVWIWLDGRCVCYFVGRFAISSLSSFVIFTAQF